MTQKALGLIETIGLVTAIEAADAASKAANVKVIGYENSKGGGLITVKLVGDVGAVKAAVSAGVAAAQRIGRIASQQVIPRPHEEIEALIEQVTRGQGGGEPEQVKETPKAKPTARAAKAKPARSAKPAESEPQPETSSPEAAQPEPPSESPSPQLPTAESVPTDGV
ncbi:MAG TPA: BMC domain-containing protein [Anaerolineae bacterium]|nr:BMC domain-containing protein [Anaerolineae bacterium]